MHKTFKALHSINYNVQMHRDRNKDETIEI